MRITRAVVPSLFTVLNMFCGFNSILYATKGEFIPAAWFIFLAAAFYSLDGIMARLTKSTSEFGVEIDIDDTGEVFVTGNDEEKARLAMETIKGIVKEVAIGELYAGKVRRILDFGAFVEFAPGQEGLVHISQLDNRRVAKVTDVVNVGDEVRVKVVGIDELGRVNLSIKEAKDNGNQEP